MSRIRQREEPHVLETPPLTTVNMATNADTAEVSASLRKALRLASTNRWVADWLFGASSTPFHPAPTLPPHFLRLSLGVQAMHTIVLPSTAEHPLPFTTRACDMLFVPVAETDGAVTGYTIDRGDRIVDARCPPPAPFAPPFVGRFAFDTLKHDLVVVTAPGPSPLTGIIAMYSGPHSRRQQFIFTVPSGEYSFGHLPSTVLSMYSHAEYPIEPICFDRSLQLCGTIPETRWDLAIERDPLVRENESYSYDGITAADSDPTTEEIPELDVPLQQNDRPCATDSFLSDLLRDNDQTHSPRLTTSTERNTPSPMLLPDPIICLPMTDNAEASQREPYFTDIWNNTSEPFRGLENDPASVMISSPSEKLTSHLPWFMSSTGTTADGMSPSFSADATDTSSGAFSTSRLSLAVATLRSALSGKYYGPFVRMDMLHVLTGKYTTSFTGRINYSVTKLEGTSMTALEHTFADKYYLAALSISPDQLLIHASHVTATIQIANELFKGTSARQAEADVWNNTEAPGLLTNEDAARTKTSSGKNGVKVQSCVNADERVLLTAVGVIRGSAVRPVAPAPLIATPLWNPDDTEATKGGGAACKEERRKRLAEARRLRNRLSAARSNLRKREKAQAALEEIERNRELVEELTKRKRAMITENERLRRLISESPA